MLHSHPPPSTLQFNYSYNGPPFNTAFPVFVIDYPLLSVPGPPVYFCLLGGFETLYWYFTHYIAIASWAQDRKYLIGCH